MLLIIDSMQLIWLVQGTGLVFVDTIGITPPVYVPLGSNKDTATISIDYSGNNLVSVNCTVIHAPTIRSVHRGRGALEY